jgi:outer membrane protein assembly factor BamB
MGRRIMKRLAILVCTALLLAGGVCNGDEWPQWRGPGRDGLWRETGIIEKFAGEQIPVKWRVQISNGYSGPTVADGRVYVTDRVRQPEQIERVLCFDAMTGRELWTHTYPCMYRRVGHPDGPRACVTIDEGRAYSLGTMGHLFCINAEKGKVIWSKDLKAEYDLKIPRWGISAAPLVEKDLVIVHVGGGENACVIAFDKKSGEERWRALGDEASYSAPIVIDQAGKRVVIVWTAERIVGLDAAGGEVYWSIPAKAKMGQAVATPVVQGDLLFISGFFDGSLLLKLDKDKPAVTEVWRRGGESESDTDALHCCISTPILAVEHIYGVCSYGELRCLETGTGRRVWESLEAGPKERWATIHLVPREEEVWMFNERGELIISKLSPKGFEEVSRAKLIKPTEGQLDRKGGVCWSHPAFAYRHIYIRNDEELICADLGLRKKDADSQSTK